MHIPLGTLKFREGVEFGFPQHLCCNCGTTKDTRVIAQDTRRTTYLVAGGTETTFQLPLPFCADCAPSAKRRPKSVVHRLLVFAMAFAACFAALVIHGEFSGGATIPSSLLGPVALVLAAIITLGLVLMARPKAGQTSYFQPVRIPKLKREFMSGAVTAIGFGFTNRDYAKAFRQANKDAVARKLVLVELS